MNNVVNIRSFVEAANPPTLVLVGLQQDDIADSSAFGARNTADAIANCRAALRHARACGFPIALVRRSRRAQESHQDVPHSHWIEGFEPTRTDMVFERNRPSCFASSAFAEVMANTRGNFVLAGFAGEGACLATALEAFHRGHRVTFLTDASTSRTLEGVAASDVHRIVSRIIGTCGEAAHTDAWIAATSRWTKRLGRNNGNEHGRTAR